MTRDLFSYWLTVTGEYTQCRQFHQDLKARGIVPDILQQNVNESEVHMPADLNDSNTEPSTILYQAGEETDTIEEVEDIFEQINHVVSDYPDLMVSLESIDEDDHARQSHYVWYRNKCLMDHARIEIKTIEQLKQELKDALGDVPLGDIPKPKEIYWAVSLSDGYYDKLVSMVKTAENKDDIPECKTLHSTTRILDDGLELNAKIYSGGEDGPLWTKVVLLQDGTEVCHSEMGYGLDETLRLTHDNITYIVNFTKTMNQTVYVNQKPITVTFTCPTCEKVTHVEYDKFEADHGEPSNWPFSVLTCPYCGQRLEINNQEWY